jgi:hypothetical protein
MQCCTVLCVPANGNVHTFPLITKKSAVQLCLHIFTPASWTTNVFASPSVFWQNGWTAWHRKLADKATDGTSKLKWKPISMPLAVWHPTWEDEEDVKATVSFGDCAVVMMKKGMQHKDGKQTALLHLMNQTATCKGHWSLSVVQEMLHCQGHRHGWAQFHKSGHKADSLKLSEDTAKKQLLANACTEAIFMQTTDQTGQFTLQLVMHWTTRELCNRAAIWLTMATPMMGQWSARKLMLWLTMATPMMTQQSARKMMLTGRTCHCN